MTKFLYQILSFIGAARKHLQVVEVFSSNDKECYRLTLIDKNKTVLKTTKTIVCRDLNEIHPHLLQKDSIIWIYNTERLLVHVAKNEESDTLANTFPNLKINDFFIQKNTNVVTFCRKKTFYAFEEHVKESGLPFTYCFLGYHPIFSLLNVLEKTVHLPQRIFEHDGKSILAFETSHSPFTEEVAIGEESVENEKALGLAATIAYLRFLRRFKKTFPTYPLPVGDANNLSKDFSNVQLAHTLRFQNKKFRKYFLKGSLIFFLSILTLNFFLFSWFTSKKEALALQDEALKITSQKIQAREKSILEKSKLLKQYTFFSQANTAHIIDTLLLKLPKTIMLNNLTYQPLQKKITADEPLQLDNNTVVISGRITQKKDFNQWVSYLKKLTKVKAVNIVQFGTLETRTINFEINIDLTDESK